MVNTIVNLTGSRVTKQESLQGVPVRGQRFQDAKMGGGGFALLTGQIRTQQVALLDLAT